MKDEEEITPLYHKNKTCFIMIFSKQQHVQHISDMKQLFKCSVLKSNIVSLICCISKVYNLTAVWYLY